MIVEQTNSKRLDTLRRRINDETYLHAAIQRLALVLSNELMDINNASKMREGRGNEQQWKRRK